MAGALIIPRTQANNRKSAAATIADQQEDFENLLRAQLKPWKAMIPGVITRLSEIEDPRDPLKIKHKIATLMFYGVLMSIFNLNSRRDFNITLTTPAVTRIITKIFPEIGAAPHADTIARVLKSINLDDLEKIHTDMVRKLIKNKKFKKLLINGYYPISIDGTQKAVRNGELQAEGWSSRTITTKDGKEIQQYVYTLEANITFPNGLSIPLLTEHCYLEESDEEENEDPVQDCELTAFTRLAAKTKHYFPKLKIMLVLDNLYACENVIALANSYGWGFMIKLPSKLKSLYGPLEEQEKERKAIPGQPFYRNRSQKFYWLNNLKYAGYTVHLVACVESWSEVCKTTGDIKPMYSKHTWISSTPLSIKNVHDLCNQIARKRALIEDSFNTEKNRGFQYQHLFSYNWNAMKGFHCLMRLAHAISAISEFTKGLKKYIKELGVANTISQVLKAVEGLWLTDKFLDEELLKTPQLRFQFE